MKNVEFQKFIRRSDVQSNRNKIYVFGDNLLHVGYGGQAKEMRGEYNTIGIPTKISPYKYLSDENYDTAVPVIKSKFETIYRRLKNGYVIVIPKAGVGAGLADLPNKAPKIWKVVREELEKLGWENGFK